MTNQGIQHIIEETGGCGRYQIILSFIVHSMKCIVVFSGMTMVFGAKVPDWWCVDNIPFENTTIDSNSTALHFKTCNTLNGTCNSFRFDDSISTVVSEWGLVCSRDWIPTTILTLQMAGLFSGNILSGQVADLVGRKHPLFLAVLLQVVFNIISAFSTSWRMFAVLRFLIGFSCGIQLTVQYCIQSEFTEARWRSWIVAVPSYALQSMLFALTVWLLRDWRYIHFVTAATGFPWLLTYWFVPESYRWYLSHGRMEDAKRVIYKVARVNRRKDFVLDEKDLMVETGDVDGEDRQYTFLDLIKNPTLLKLSILLFVNWIVVGMGSYGIGFGVPSLSGDLYLNIFIVALFGSPIQFLDIFLMNRFGRKPTIIFFFAIFTVTALFVGIAKRMEDTYIWNSVSNWSAIVALTAVNAVWSPVQTHTTELYPTVVRNIGYGTQNTMARAGSILGPQLLYLDAKVPGLMYFVCAGLTVLATVATLCLPETHLQDLDDTLQSGPPNKEAALLQAEKRNGVV